MTEQRRFPAIIQAIDNQLSAWEEQNVEFSPMEVQELKSLVQALQQFIDFSQAPKEEAPKKDGTAIIPSSNLLISLSAAIISSYMVAAAAMGCPAGSIIGHLFTTTRKELQKVRAMHKQFQLLFEGKEEVSDEMRRELRRLVKRINAIIEKSEQRAAERAKEREHQQKKEATLNVR